MILEGLGKHEGGLRRRRRGLTGPQRGWDGFEGGLGSEWASEKAQEVPD